MATKQNDAAFVGIQADFASPRYSDLVVLCGTDKYMLHRAIICARSKFFEAACDEGFEV